MAAPLPPPPPGSATTTAATRAAPAAATAAAPEAVVVVVDNNPNHNWYKTFKGAQLWDGTAVRVEQTAWEELRVAVDLTTGDLSPRAAVLVELQPAREPIFGSPMKNHRTVRPEGVLVRNFARGLKGVDYRNYLFALQLAGVVGVNSLDSIVACLDRPAAYAAMFAIARRLGHDRFPVIPLRYYANVTEEDVQATSLPAVAKQGASHAGYGKVLLREPQQLRDYVTVLALHTDYVTLEPFIERSAEYRVQKIGRDHYRAWRRLSDSWKANMGVDVGVEDMPVEDRHRLWADEAQAILGGLDVCSVDVIVDRHTGKEWILEINDTGTGFHPRHIEEDMGRIRDVMLEKLSAARGLPPPAAAAAATAAKSS